MTRPTVGSKLGNYRLERVLGEGRMGIVFLAHDEALLRHTAVKVLAWKFPADESVRTPDAHLLAEAQLAARIDHPNVVRVYGVARQGVHCFIGMEYVEGISAESAVKRHGVFALDRAHEILVQAAAGLQAVHDAKVVHRDLKPENVLIATDGTTKLVDFGMALALVRGRATEANRAGTPFYTAPELWQGSAASVASDIYALGATYYYLLTGRPPFEATDLTTLIDAHLNQPIPDVRLARADLPERCHALIQRCLAKAPGDRFGTAQEIAWAARGLMRQAAEAPRSRARNEGVRSVTEESPPPLTGAPLDLFGPAGVDDPQLEGAPFDDLRTQLATLGTQDGPAVMLLVGEPGSGRTMLARHRVADHRRHGVAIYLGAHPDAARPMLSAIALPLGVVAVPGDARATVDRLVHHLADPPTRRPALVVVDRALAGAELAELALLGRAAEASGGFCVLVIGGPELPTALGALGLPDRTRTVAVPPLTASQTLRYIQHRLRRARTRAPELTVTPDAGLLVFHHSAGSLARIDHLMRAMLTRAAHEQRRVLSSRDVTLAADPAATPTRAPGPTVLDLLDAGRREIGIAPRRRAESGPHRQVERVAQLPDVTSVVLGHASGAVLDAARADDAEVAATADARCVRAFARAGALLGLGELRTGALVGDRATRLLHRAPGLVLASVVDADAALPPLEDQISQILRD